MKMRSETTEWIRRGGLAIAAVLALQVPAMARCPVPADGALFVRAPLGNLNVQTTANGFVEVEVSNPAIRVQEECFDDHVEISGEAPQQAFGPVDWTIRVPRSINLDLTTFAGTIRVAQSDGTVTARTTGGSVVASNIGGGAAMITQGGSILVGNIGGNAELRSLGGQIEIGNVGGNAELETMGGPITAGIVSGYVRAETAGGAIRIEESRGDLNAVTLAGDIHIGTAARATAQTAGGNIIGKVIRGPFRGFTELGNIVIELAQSSIEAVSGIGDITARLVPTSMEGDLHVTLRTNSGNIRLTIPENMPANLEAIIDRAILQEPRIRSDFPLERASTNANLPPFVDSQFAAAPARSVTILNGGGNPIRVQTSRGTIEIRKIAQ